MVSFDSIDRERLMGYVERRVSDRRVLKLVRKWLDAGVMEDGVLRETVTGTPQGGVISPLMANIYLHVLDRTWAERGVGTLVRYADDAVIMCRSREEAEAALGLVGEVLAELGLELHPDKTRIVDLGEGREGFDFLGCHFQCVLTSCAELAGESPAGVAAKRPRSWWPAEGETRPSKRHDKVASGGEQACGPYVEESCRVVTAGLREPSPVEVGEGHGRCEDLEEQHREPAGVRGSGTCAQFSAEQERSVSAPASQVRAANPHAPVKATAISGRNRERSKRRAEVGGGHTVATTARTTEPARAKGLQPGVRFGQRRLRACPSGHLPAPLGDQAKALLERLGRRPTLVAKRNAVVRLPGGEPCEGEPQARFWEGVLETAPVVQGDGLSPCVGNPRMRQPGLPTLETAPAPYSTARVSGRLLERGIRRYYLHRWPSARSMKKVRQRVKELTGRNRTGVKDIRMVISGLNPILRGWGNYFRTGNAADKFIQVDRYVWRRLMGFMRKRHGRNLHAGQADRWTEEWFNDLGLYRLRGTIRYPEAA